MPGTEKQRRFFGAELARKRAGQQTKTDMTESQMSDYASKPDYGPVSEADRKKRRFSDGAAKRAKLA